jgi:D-lactate dehydrogenase (cytochrome)
MNEAAKELASAKPPSGTATLDETLLAELREAVGREHVRTDRAERAYFSQDVYRAGQLASAVVSPGSRDETARVVAAAARRGVAVHARGGGMSYTDAFLPERSPALVLDLSRLTAIRRIEPHDLYVTVEAGCTWAALDEALAPHGLRSTFWGPMSGHTSTVGGAMSQGAVTFGSGRNGPSTAAALGYEVVLADGSVLLTGPDAQAHRKPFMRHYGPDLTGVFSCDGGAFGIKTAVTLQLEPRPAERAAVSLAFDDFGALVEGVRAVTRRGLATEVFGAETALVRQVAGDSSFTQDLATLWQVGRAAGGPFRALGTMASIAAGGRRFLTRSRYLVNFLTEAPDRAHLKAQLRAIRSATAGHGYEIPNTMAEVVKAVPFPTPMVLGPGGRRLLPLHAVVPYSAASALQADFERLLEAHREALSMHDIDVFVVYATSGLSGFLWECVIYWPDEWLEIHRRTMDPQILAHMQESAPRPEARAAVEALRLAIVDLMHRHGGAHFQIGRAYPYLRDRSAPSLELLRQLKRDLDPQRILNPGALGL